MSRVTFKVNCPRDLGIVRSMAIQLVQREDGSYLPAPCSGCEFADGDKACLQCMDRIFQMSLKDLTMKSYPQPITPQTI